MSLVAPCLAVRNMLRSSLTGFYDNADSALQASRRALSCKIMPDDRPAPNSGREFISIYASGWEIIESSGQGNDLYGLHERVTVTVAVTQRYADVPFDRLGEAAYMADEDVFIQQYKTISDRLREIVTIIHPDYVNFQAQMAALLVVSVSNVDKTLQPAYDKLWFVGADSAPQIVGPEHFHAQASTQAPSGLLMRARFRGASRLHWMTTLDQHSA